MENEKVTQPNKSDWFLRFIKGMFIGSGFILPGVSGGALAAVFGIYERIISFLAHITKNFKENVKWSTILSRRIIYGFNRIYKYVAKLDCYNGN